MAAKSKVILRSDFPAAKKGAHDAIVHARDLALEAGQETANKRLELADRSRDYNLPADVEKEMIGFQSGKIIYDHLFGKWFEYGTTYIAAMPFMRPAHRKMRKVFLAEAGIEKFIRRRARRL